MSDDRHELFDRICCCLLVPFYPIILPLFLPYYYYCEHRAERNIRERRRNDNRSGYDGFQEKENKNETIST